ncbi:MAG: hypothetical protein AAGF01_25175 [Cyanobacteria bacterium P01_G01_bin.38]
MASNISHKKLNSVEQQLAELAEAGPQSFSLKAAVEKLMPTIEAARRRKVRWPQIAKIINKALGNQQTSERTIRQYYYAFRNSSKGHKLEGEESRLVILGSQTGRPTTDDESVTDSSVAVLPIEQTKEAQPRVKQKSAAKKSRRFTKDVRPKRS